MIHNWTIKQNDLGTRLDVFLTSQLDNITRSTISKLLKRGAATVNGKPATVHRFLKVGDKVEFEDEAELKSQRAEGPKGKAKPIAKVEILHETDEWVVINKPSGLIVHPDNTHKTNTLVDFLLEKYPSMAKVGEDPSRPGIMHRLDKEVSGLMVIAKTEDAFDSLKRQFAEHSVDKKYHALVYGKIIGDEGDIKFRIARSKSKARMAARPVHEEEGRAAWTNYKVLKRFSNASLLELQILTGRTHQIRAHLLALGHPVIGDPLYKIRKSGHVIDTPRLMLQAVELSFNDPKSGERKKFELALDSSFKKVAKSLKGTKAEWQIEQESKNSN